MKGIDVSVHNGIIDFAKVKAAGIEYVIIRAGYGREISQKDMYFERNYKAAKAAGLLVGAYWYSYADSVSAAQKEAEACIAAIKGKKFEFPIYFDIEEQKQFDKGVTFCSDLVKTFCNALEKAGYFAGFYTGRYAVMHYISKEVAQRYALWIAEWGARVNYSGSYGMWQYASTGKVNGISGNVDMDTSYVDYPAIIKRKGLNGYGMETTYTVKDGDTLSAIANKYSTTVDNIVAKNGLIKTGQVLKV
jgi:GH25 family lysozyme M1 (1,4-beta-N-acetylmuramidase)